MTKFKFAGKAVQKLRRADNDLTTAQINLLTDLTASAAEINVVDGVTAGTVTASKAIVVDANSGFQGHTKVVEAHTAGDTLTVAETGSIHTNEGASGEVTLVLPAATAGLFFQFYVMAAQELRIDPSGTETIAIAGTQQAAGKYITANAVGEHLTLVCVTDGQWEDIDTRGTWTAEA